MKLISKVVFGYFINLIALIIMVNFVAGFYIPGQFTNILIVAAIFTLINLLIKPVVSFILGPLKILTLGLSSLIINAAMLYLLDILSTNVTITSIKSLIYATLVIGIINLILSHSAKSLFKSTD